MGENNVVQKIKASAEDVENTRFISDLARLTIAKAVVRLEGLDADPIFRIALTRAGIRDFVQCMAERFPENRILIAECLEEMAGDLRQPEKKPNARGQGSAPGGGRENAEGAGPQRIAGRRTETDLKRANA